jgi:hypothetical protein
MVRVMMLESTVLIFNEMYNEKSGKIAASFTPLL